MIKKIIPFVTLALFSCDISGVKTNQPSDDFDTVEEVKKQELGPEQTTSDTIKNTTDTTGRVTKVLPSGVKVVWEKQTDAPRIQKGDVVRIKQTLRLTNGKVLETWKQIGEAPTICMDYGMLVKGIEEGVYQLGKGEKAKLFVPSSEAYGKRGVDGLIPPNSDLIFEVEIVDVPQPEILEDGVKLWIVGRSDKSEPNGSLENKNITFHYQVFAQGKGMYDNSMRNGQPFSYKFGKPTVVPGLNIAMPKIRERDKAYVQIPAKMAYGSKGLKDKVPANTNIMYDVMMLKNK